MEVTNTKVDPKDQVPIESRTVSDAFEGKVYAHYFWINNERKKYWEVPPRQCDVTTLTGERVVCKSGEEYEHLIQELMDK